MSDVAELLRTLRNAWRDLPVPDPDDEDADDAPDDHGGTCPDCKCQMGQHRPVTGRTEAIESGSTDGMTCPPKEQPRED